MALELAHDVPMGGHWGNTKTLDRLLSRFYWPGIIHNVSQRCKPVKIVRSLSKVQWTEKWKTCTFGITDYHRRAVSDNSDGYCRSINTKQIWQ